AEAYRPGREEVHAASQEVTDAIGASLQPSGEAAVDEHALDRAAARIAQGYDPVHGGFGDAPKFPPSMTLDFLMQRVAAGFSRPDSGRLKPAPTQEIITNTPTKLARSGIYDQIGAGFPGYS